MKNFLFRWHIFLAIVILFALFLFQVLSPYKVDMRIILTIVAAVGTAVFSIQKQALEEAKLFRELFVAFNLRYDRMNESLNKIAQKRSLTQ